MELLSMAVFLHALCVAKGGYTSKLRLLQTCSGTLGTLEKGSWVAVTLNHLSLKAKKNKAEQICKHHGCGRVFEFSDNKTAPDNTSLINCIGNSLVYNCTAATPAINSKVIDIVCEHQAVRLVAGHDSCAGRVELLKDGEWGSVCDDGWNSRGGDVVCKQLDCGSALRVTGEAGDFSPGTGPTHISKLNCTGAEVNLWDCSTQEHRGSNYCGHKEDAGVVCSGSTTVTVTPFNITEPNLTNRTTVSVTEIVHISHISPSAPVWGCIVLSIALLIVLLSNAALCKHYKRKHACVIHQRYHDSHTREGRDINNLQAVTAHAVSVQTSVHGWPEARIPSLQDDSETSSDSNYEHYYHFGAQIPAYVNDLHPSDDAHGNDECNQAQGIVCSDEKCLTNTNCDALDSESKSSGECYENTEAELEQLLNPDVNQFYHEQSLQMGPLSHASESAKVNKDSSDSDSTSSGECYENIGMAAEAFVETLEGSPSFPELNPLTQQTPQLTGNLHEPRSLNQDDSSTSSGEDYENVSTIDKETCQCSSTSSDYDDVANW